MYFQVLQHFIVSDMKWTLGLSCEDLHQLKCQVSGKWSGAGRVTGSHLSRQHGSIWRVEEVQLIREIPKSSRGFYYEKTMLNVYKVPSFIALN